MRIILTGSQLWKHSASIFCALDTAATVAYRNRVPFVLVHGRCYRGADAIGDAWAVQRKKLGWPVSVDPHPADWKLPCIPRCPPAHRRARRDGSTFCPMVGMYRNESMVRLGGDGCIAMNRDKSSGTTACSSFAASFGIPVLTITWEDRNDVARLAVPFFSTLNLAGSPRS